MKKRKFSFSSFFSFLIMIVIWDQSNKIYRKERDLSRN